MRGKLALFQISTGAVQLILLEMSTDKQTESISVLDATQEFGK